MNKCRLCIDCGKTSIKMMWNGILFMRIMLYMRSIMIPLVTIILLLSTLDPAEIIYLIFQPLDVVDCVSDPQHQVVENYPYLLRPNVYKCWCLKRHLYGIRRSLNGWCSITEVKQRRARFIIEWVTAWDCQVLYTLSWGSENHVNQMARLTDLELDVKEPQWT